MEEYVYIDGKKYRRGYTTGSCAAAASKAATYMLITQKKIESVNIDTPKGIYLTLKPGNIEINKEYAICSIQKDGGEDIYVTGGIGVGTVTKKGLKVEVGKSAINPVPMNMIKTEIRKVLGTDLNTYIDKTKTLKITIYAPQGVEIAKKTFNPRLGIVGGISILGTSGIVEPMSDEGWKKSLSIELEMKRSQGLDKIILVPGNHGEEFIQNELGLDIKYVVRMSNFVGYMLMEAKRMGYKKILLAGHIGKFIKVSAGIFHTHSKVADARNEIMISNLALMGAPLEFLQEIDKCVTAEGAVEIIDQSEYTGVYEILCNKCRDRVKQHLGDDDIEVGVYMFRMDKSYLAKSDNADSIVEVFR